jgi:hypothetical protein
MNPLTAGKGTEQLLSDALWCRVVQEDERPTGAIHAARPNYLAPDVSIPQHEPVTLGVRDVDRAPVVGDVGESAKHAALGNRRATRLRGLKTALSPSLAAQAFTESLRSTYKNLSRKFCICCEKCPNHPLGSGKRTTMEAGRRPQGAG